MIILGISIVVLLMSGIYFLNNYDVQSVADMMGGAPSSNILAISLVLIGAAIALSIGAVLLFIYPNKQTSTAIRQIDSTVNTKTETLRPWNSGSQHNAIVSELKPFNVFLCYKKSSGKDFADHLKLGLEELGLHTFEDCKDIPLTVDTEEGWAKCRDKALEESKYFVLIMTPGFNLSPEVVKEIEMARKQANKTFIFFRHRSMGRNIEVNLGSEILDLGKLEQVSFESKEELLRLADNILFKC